MKSLKDFGIPFTKPYHDKFNNYYDAVPTDYFEVIATYSYYEHAPPMKAWLWCIANTKGNCLVDGGGGLLAGSCSTYWRRYYFEDRNDAIMFKLKWGGDATNSIC